MWSIVGIRGEGGCHYQVDRAIGFEIDCVNVPLTGLGFEVLKSVVLKVYGPEYKVYGFGHREWSHGNVMVNMQLRKLLRPKP